MARMPSMVALLGLLAVAGYQNRDKLGGFFGGVGNETGGPANPNRQTGGLGDLLNGLGGMLSGATAGSILSGGLGDLVERFRQAGRGDKADSWVNIGDNVPVETSDLEAALGEETILELTEKTGLSREELLKRLTETLPEAVSQMTPEGRLPTEQEVSRFSAR